MKHTMIFIAVLVMLGSSVANATIASVVGHVTKVMIVDDGKWGGCMVMLDTSVRAKLPSCPNSSWVTLSCDGTFSPKDTAYRKLDSAQMAKALNSEITVRVNDSKTINGFCYAEQLTVK